MAWTRSLTATKGPGRTDERKWWVKGVFWGYLVLFGGGVGYGVLFYFQAGRAIAQQPVPPPPVATPGVPGPSGVPSAAENDYRSLGLRLTYAEKDIDNLEKVLGLMVTIAALFGIALGVNAYISLKQTFDSAQRELDTISMISKAAHEQVAGVKADTEIAIRRVSDFAEKQVTEVKTDAKEKLEGLKGEIRAYFPAIANMEETLERVLFEMRDLLKVDIDWVNHYYDTLPEKERQTIRLAELTVAGFRFFDLQAQRRDASAVYHGMAIFYASRYAHEYRCKMLESEARERADAGGQTSFVDSGWNADPEGWERAHHYFRIATGTDRNNIRAKKDHAVLFSINKNDEDCIREAIRRLEFIRPAHWKTFPGIALNLGVAYLNPRIKRYRDALDRFSDLIGFDKWNSDDERQKYLPVAYYNRAAARARLASQPPAGVDSVAIAEAVADVRASLDRATGKYATLLRETLPGDVRADKDLELLAPYIQDLLT